MTSQVWAQTLPHLLPMGPPALPGTQKPGCHDPFHTSQEYFGDTRCCSYNSDLAELASHGMADPAGFASSLWAGFAGGTNAVGCI